MKRSRKQIQIRLKQGASFLLVLLFLGIAAAPVLHEHTEAHISHQEQSVLTIPSGLTGQFVLAKHQGFAVQQYFRAEAFGEQEQLQLSDKCSVCDYYHHIQGKQIFSHYLLELPAVFSKVIRKSPHLFTGNYKITVQGFTNKGPPQTA